MVKRIVYIVLLSFLQIAVMVIIYEWALHENPLPKKDVPYTFYIHYLVYFYSALTMIVNMILVFGGLNWISSLFAVALLVCFDFYVIGAYSTYPNRTLFLIFLTNGLIIFSFAVSYFLGNIKNKTH